MAFLATLVHCWHFQTAVDQHPNILFLPTAFLPQPCNIAWGCCGQNAGPDILYQDIGYPHCRPKDLEQRHQSRQKCDVLWMGSLKEMTAISLSWKRCLWTKRNMSWIKEDQIRKAGVSERNSKRLCTVTPSSQNWFMLGDCQVYPMR